MDYLTSQDIYKQTFGDKVFDIYIEDFKFETEAEFNWDIVIHGKFYPMLTNSENKFQNIAKEFKECYYDHVNDSKKKIYII